MTAIYTFDVFCTLDGYASYEGGDWGGYWGKGGPDLDARRLAVYSEDQRMVLGANTYRHSWRFRTSWPVTRSTPA